LALSANSPFIDGEATGMLSNRAEILTQLPRAGAPPAFGSYDGFEAWVERLMRIGVLEDYTRIWWDVRPHPHLGTLEIRIADQPTSLERTELLVPVLRGLGDDPGERHPLRALCRPACRRTHRARRARGCECDPHGPRHAGMGRRADDARRAARRDGARRLPRDRRRIADGNSARPRGVER